MFDRHLADRQYMSGWTCKTNYKSECNTFIKYINNRNSK